jgi:hypothetical protein
VWTLDGTTWTEKNMSTPLPPRYGGSFDMQLPRGRALLFGGEPIAGASYDDTWEFDGSAWSPVITDSHPPGRAAHVGFPSRNAGEVIVFGGVSGIGSDPPLTDTWRFRYASNEPREQCELAVDNDGDGLVGCADPDCWTVCTPLCPPGQPCDPAAPKCGDGVCNTALENCRNCPGDCTCTPVCGDTFCDGGETHATCPGDCP